jgi:hypothetical protein
MSAVQTPEFMASRFACTVGMKSLAIQARVKGSIEHPRDCRILRVGNSLRRGAYCPGSHEKRAATPLQSSVASRADLSFSKSAGVAAMQLSSKQRRS